MTPPAAPPSRASRTVRGVLAVALAVHVAAFFHVAGGGAAPAPAVVALTVAFASPAAIAANPIATELAMPRAGGALPSLARRGRRGGAHRAASWVTAGADARSARSSRAAPALSSGLFWLPHLGDCTHDGQPSSHSQASIVSSVADSQARAAR